MAVQPVWHFNRSALAAIALSTLQSGLAQAITLMAPRQMGKSEFLQYDLLPHAEEHGWRVRYFGCATVSPRALTRRLQEALSDFAAGEKWLMRQFARLAGQHAATARAAFPERLVQELAQLRNEKKPSLLVIDDVDRVLQLAGGDTLLREILRAFAGTNGQARLVLSSTLTGHHQGLPALLQQQTTVLTLPDIGDAFVHHLVGQYHQLTRTKREDDNPFGKLSPYQGITWGQVDEGIMQDAFNRLQRIPYYFRALVEDLVLNPERAPAEALQVQLARLQRHRVAVLSWEEMSRLDRLLLTEVAKGTRQFYGDTLRQYLAAQTGAARVSTSQVQSSLKKLMRNRVLGQEADGRYLIIDPHLAAALSVTDKA
ncbi:ATP-binding protein [Silvimonas iriomotensis]|uniref:AAA domain-containing protein n=1 Tax=Silvimonas iriomotensis TaxID=449662 RepID=A0ABQ2PBS5_9NEIS|nr:ATP-binding protein [Silvimonas iriomotensis]GGP22542.1 hypothetical protein GCM10010970_25750 [Silvimonas iriomotensis]